MKNLKYWIVLAMALGRVRREHGKILNQIGDSNDHLGNGDWEVRKYSVKNFSKKKAIQEVEKRRFEGCTWKTITSRRAVIKAIRTDMPGDVATADALQELYDDGLIKSAIAVQSDYDISCSRLYVYVYTVDGYELELNYDQSD